MKRFLASLTMIGLMFGIVAAVPAEPQLRKAKVTVTKVEVLQPPAAAAQVEATAKKTGVVFNIALRAKIRQELRAKGYGIVESARLANQTTDEVINFVMADAEALSGTKVVGTAIGDGKIFQAIIDFFKSPQGQALLDALLKLLLGLLLVHENPAGTWHSALQAWNA